jgi:hypothetical protein
MHPQRLQWCICRLVAAPRCSWCSFRPRRSLTLFLLSSPGMGQLPPPPRVPEIFCDWRDCVCRRRARRPSSRRHNSTRLLCQEDDGKICPVNGPNVSPSLGSFFFWIFTPVSHDVITWCKVMIFLGSADPLASFPGRPEPCEAPERVRDHG